MTMRSTVFALVTATTAICFFGVAGSASAGQGETVCTWGGTPAAPTGVATFSPGITNTPSTGPIQFTATGVLAGAARAGKHTGRGELDGSRRGCVRDAGAEGGDSSWRRRRTAPGADRFALARGGTARHPEEADGGRRG